MRRISFFGVFGLSCLLLLGHFSSIQAAPLGTAFSFQGSLTDKGQPANATYDFIFALYDAASGGTVVGSPLTMGGIAVSKGQFTVVLDFGTGIFTGAARWLEISVRTQNKGDYTTLTPRQALTPTPYALYADRFSGKMSGNSEVAILNINNTYSGEGLGGAGCISAFSMLKNDSTIMAISGGTGSRAIFGITTSNNTDGILGWADLGTSNSNAIHGYARGPNSTGVFGQADQSGGIGVRGSGVLHDFYATGANSNFGPFTGAHEVRLSEEFPQNIKPGMIVSVTGQNRIRIKENGAPSLSSTLPTIKLSNQAADKAVFGVLVAEGPLPTGHWYSAEEGERFAIVNALGEGRVWVSNINGDIKAGDYITTSTIPGYGQLQGDDLLRSFTLGKAIETVDWDSVSETIMFNGQAVKVYLIAVVYTSG